MNNTSCTMFKIITQGLACLCFLLGGCKPKPRLDPRQGFIMGQNNMKPSSRENLTPVPVQKRLAFVLIVTRKLKTESTKFCSGVLVDGETPNAPQRVLTNHHCFAVEKEGEASRTITAEACLQTRVYMGYFADQHQKVTTHICKVGTLRTHYESDLAVFSLGKRVELETIQVSQLKDVSNRAAYVVHYPDVTQNYVSSKDGGLNLPVAAITSEDCRSLNDFGIENMGFDRSLPFGIQHTCDIIEGSSGSGLIDAVTHELLGVDWGGIKIQKEHQEEAYNVATRAEFVRMFLEGREEELKTHYVQSQQNIESYRASTEKNSAEKKQSPGCAVR